MRVSPLVAALLLVAGCALPIVLAPEKRWIARAEELARARDYRGAEEAYRRVLSEYPASASTDRLLLGLGRLYVAPDNPERNYRRAHERFQRLVEEFPASAWASEARAWRDLLAAYLSQAEEAQRARHELQRIRRDLEQLKQIERELEQRRRRR